MFVIFKLMFVIFPKKKVDYSAALSQRPQVPNLLTSTIFALLKCKIKLIDICEYVKSTSMRITLSNNFNSNVKSTFMTITVSNNFNIY